MKIVINRRFGGFSISKEAAEFMAARENERAKRELKARRERWFGYGYVDGMEGGYDRSDPDLVAAVETLGEKANGHCAKLKVVEIPDSIEYYIDDYDGIESVHQSHKSWS